MDNKRSLIQFNLLNNPETSTHYHQNIELFYVLDGKLRVQVDDTSFLMEKNDVLLVNSNKHHTVTGDEDIFAVRFEIDFFLLSEYTNSINLLFWCNSVVDKNAAYYELVDLLDQILLKSYEKDRQLSLDLQALYFQTAHVLVSNFLIKADNVKMVFEESQDDKLRIQYIKNYVQSNYSSQISLGDLAEQLFLSNAYLSKYIKKHLGMTFMDYLNNVRLFHAVDELLYTNKNMTHIALDNGFPSSAAFTKAFRKTYKESPSKYREKIESQREKSNLNEEIPDGDLEKIRLILNMKKSIASKRNEENKEYDINVKSDTKKLSSCYKAICVGDAYSILKSDVQNQLKDIKDKTGVVYIRIWNIFSNKECYDEKEGYSFRKITRVLDFIVENNMRPYLELGSKDTILNYTPEKYMKANLSTEHTDIKLFEFILKEFCIHLVNRYGIDEIETWYFEYYNYAEFGIIDRQEMNDENGNYYKFFEVIYKTLKSISPNIKLGGAGFILGYGTNECMKAINVWKNREISPDFLSVYSYQYIAVEDEGTKYGRKSIDVDYMKNQIDILKNRISELGIKVKEFHISEWNFTISNRNVLNDSCEQGAYILKNCIDMNGEVEVMAYWHALDSYSDYYDADMILNGDSGIITRDGIRKPSFYAYMFMNKLLPEVIAKNENSIITTDGRNNYVIACHNYKKLSAQYVFTDEDKITVETQENYLDNADPVCITYRLNNIKNGEYLVKTFILNKNCGSVQDLWRKLEYTKNLSKEEMNYLRQSAIPGIEIKKYQVEDNVLEIKNNIMTQEIRLLDIQYRYNSKHFIDFQI